MKHIIKQLLRENFVFEDKDFAKNRLAGAEKIIKNAKEKGGDAILSYYHFAAKDRPYNDIIKIFKIK